MNRIAFVLFVILLGACHPFEATDAGFDQDLYCRQGQVRCDDQCASLNSSRRHCGTCGNECAQGEVCIEGGCAILECEVSELACNNRCVDPMSEDLHCGECNNRCNEGAECLGGMCVCDGVPCDGCPVGQVLCEGACVDPGSNPNHCGICGVSCDPDGGGRCENAMCCDGPDCICVGTLCGEACLSDLELANDPLNCGECGAICPALSACVEGQCSGPEPVLVTAGEAHTCAMYDDATVRCWGDNSFGQLTGEASSATGPFEVPFPGDVEVAVVRAGGWHTCAVAKSNEVYCWGHNLSGQVDPQPNAPEVLPPTRVNSPTLGTVVLSNSIAPGQKHTCLEDGGAVLCFGDGVDGAVGPDSPANLGVSGRFNLPEGREVTWLVSGDGFSCALATDESVHCWGNLPSISQGRSIQPWYDGIQTLTAGNHHVCGSVVDQGDRYLVCGGTNEDGQLNGIPSSASSAEEVQDFAPNLLTGGDRFGCLGLSGETKLECWGATPDQLGEPALHDMSIGQSLIDLDAGSEHLCIIARDGNGTNVLHCMGDNDAGQVSPDSGISVVTSFVEPGFDAVVTP